jgi:hypothetical protein
VGRVYFTNDDRLLVRFCECGRNYVNCFIDADKAGPLAGKVKHGGYQVVLLEGKVVNSDGRVVTMEGCRVIWGVAAFGD